MTQFTVKEYKKKNGGKYYCVVRTNGFGIFGRYKKKSAAMHKARALEGQY